MSRRTTQRASRLVLAGSVVLAVTAATLSPSVARAATVNPVNPVTTVASTPVTNPPTEAQTLAANQVSTADEWKAPTVTVVAAALKRMTPVYETATATKPFKIFDNRLNFSGRHVFIVIAQEGNSYRVQLPMRPNGRVGYVRAADVTLYQHDYALKVDLSEHTLIVYKAGKEIQRDTVAVGQSKYPTPTGLYFLRELARPSNPRGSYGPWAFGLSAYSNVLQKFGRGDGQIGIHGTNEPAALGTNASHGCIRMTNASITKLAKTLPQGVPIDIVA